jgi:uncharacterized protein DUF4489
MSKSYMDCKKDDCMKYKKDDCFKYTKCDCKPKCPKQLEKEIRLACGTRGREFDLSGRTGQTLDLASVNIDLGGLICPIVKIDFSTTIEFEVETAAPGSADFLDLDLEFILTRTCEDGIEQELETYDFVRDFNITQGNATLIARTTDPISFTFCDCVNSCQVGCCTYQMKVLVVNIDELPVQVVRIDASFINAVAQGVKAC